MFGSSLPPVAYRRARVLFTLLVFVCKLWCSTHIVFVFFVVLCSLCCQFLWIVPFWLPLRYSLMFIYTGKYDRSVDSHYNCNKHMNKYYDRWLSSGPVVSPISEIHSYDITKLLKSVTLQGIKYCCGVLQLPVHSVPITTKVASFRI
jgi:hypothetical protein